MEAESFDKKIRELLESPDFPYQEADWMQAQVLLQKERKRRGLWWLWLLPAMAIGTSWWLFMPAEAEMPQPVHTKEVHVARALVASEPTTVVNQEVNAADAGTTAGHASAAGNSQTSNPALDMSSGSTPLATTIPHVRETPNAIDKATPARESIISLMRTRMASLQSIPPAYPVPSTRLAEPVRFERPNAKSSPLFGLGLYTSSQPTWQQTSERGTGRWNYQLGIFASLQFSNGFYGQWLSGIQHQNLRNFTFSNTSIRYDYGEEKTTQILELANHLSLQNTLQLGYAKGKHRMFAALTHQHYLASRYTLTTSTERQDAPVQSETTKGYAPWSQAQMQNLLMGVGYQYQINAAFRLGLQYQFSNRSVAAQAFPAAAPWQFSLQYQLFQRQQP